MEEAKALNAKDAKVERKVSQREARASCEPTHADDEAVVMDGAPGLFQCCMLLA